MKGKARAISNNDVVYLLWTFHAKIDPCLGTSERRVVAGEPPRSQPSLQEFQYRPR